MQLQRQHAGQDSAQNAQVETLKQEIIADLKRLARECNYINTQDGSPMASEWLVSTFLNSMNGKLNDLAREKMNGFNPRAIEIPYIAGPAKTFYKLQPRKKGIVLLGEEAGPAVVSESKAVKTTNFQGQNLTGIICPMREPPDPNRQLYWHAEHDFRLPNNGVMNDKKMIQCSYFDDGRLSNQTGHAPGEQITHFTFRTEGSLYYLWARREEIDKGALDVYIPNVAPFPHGTQEDYRVSKNGQPYLRQRQQYRNGEGHGRKEVFSELPSGKPYLKQDFLYANGSPHGPWKRYALDEKTGKVYLQSETIYRKGKVEKSTRYNPDGSVEISTLYNPDGSVKQ